MKRLFNDVFFGFLIVVALLSITTSLHADTLHEGYGDYTKTIKKEFDISSDGLVDLSNRYGVLEVSTWDKNRVKIEVVIIVTAGSESKAQTTFDRIDIDFSNTSDMVRACTNIENSTSSWAWNSRDEYKINYYVHMPASCELLMAHQYGDAVIAGLKNKADVSIKYGKLQAVGTEGALNLKLGYSSASIESAKNVQLDLMYSKINLNETGTVSLNSKYSGGSIERAGNVSFVGMYDSYVFGKIGDIQIKGNYNNIKIDEAEDVSISSKYTDFNLGTLHGTLQSNMSYGGLYISKLGSSFAGATIESNYTSIKIGTGNAASFKVDAYSNYAGISYPSAFQVAQERKEGSSHSVKGSYGNAGESPVLKVRVSYGGFKLY